MARLNPDPGRIDRTALGAERLIVLVLTALLILTLMVGTALLAWTLVSDLGQVQAVIAEPHRLFDVFSLFVTILVGVELLRILRHLLLVHEVNTGLVVETALIAVCNKAITLNLAQVDWTKLMGIASLILALAAAALAVRQLAARGAPAPGP